MTRGRVIAAAAMTTAISTWVVAQMWLAHHAIDLYRRQDEIGRARLLARRPDVVLAPVPAWHASQWLLPAVAGAVALICCALLSGVLAAGGRRVWAVLLPLAFPLSALVGRLLDGNSLGLAWSMQPTREPWHWFALGVAVDGCTVLSVALLALRVVPRCDAAPSATTSLLRTIPLAVVAIGWWLIGHATPTSDDRILLTRTLLLLVAVAVVVTARLPVWARLASPLVLPFVDPVLTDGLLENYHGSTYYLHRVAVGLAAAAYVGCVPWLVARVRKLSAAGDPGGSGAADKFAVG